MAKKKKEHITFDRMADKRTRLNKKALSFQPSSQKKGRERFLNRNLPDESSSSSAVSDLIGQNSSVPEE